MRSAWSPGLIIFGTLAAAGRADVELAPVFGDHAVIQRDRRVYVWGTAEAGEQVTIAFRGESASAVAGVDGQWAIAIGPFAATGDGTDLVVRGKNTIRLSDVVVGDVWLCSGQSNMELPVLYAQDGPKEITAANFPLVRQIRVRHVFSSTPQRGAPTTGWLSGTPKSAGDFSAVAYFFATEMYLRLHVPIGIVQSSYGGTPVEAWIDQEALAKDPAYPALAKRQQRATAVPFAERKARYDAACAAWESAERAALAAGTAAHATFLKQHPEPEPPLWQQCESSALFNAMIAPLVPCTVRGILWYQGESNGGYPLEYCSLFQTLIVSWRTRFRQGDLPFFWVQLPNYRTGADWARLREAQTEALAQPNTGQAVTIDVGNPADIHPRNKRDVGHRLALIAQANVFGDAVESSGPVFQSATRIGRAMRVSFTHAKGLSAPGSSVAALELASADRTFHPAVGRIEGETLVVSSPEVDEPVAVRYAFRSAPDANLKNAAGLPARPFRTDTW